jgi:ferredoxin
MLKKNQIFVKSLKRYINKNGKMRLQNLEIQYKRELMLTFLTSLLMLLTCLSCDRCFRSSTTRAGVVVEMFLKLVLCNSGCCGCARHVS